MTSKTREYKTEYNKDYKLMSYHNNSKSYKRTDNQNLQSRNDRIKYFTDKWNNLLKAAETDAQKKYCMLALKHTKDIK